MKKVFLTIIMSIILTSLISCQSNKVKFKVIEQKPSVIAHEEFSFNTTEEEVIIYKSVEQMQEDLNKKGFSITDKAFSDKYNDKYFEKKALVIIYGYDSQAGYVYNFKSLTVNNNELVLNVIYKMGDDDGITIPIERLFTIEIMKKDIKEFNKLKCKIKGDIN